MPYYLKKTELNKKKTTLEELSEGLDLMSIYKHPHYSKHISLLHSDLKCEPDEEVMDEINTEITNICDALDINTNNTSPEEVEQIRNKIRIDETRYRTKKNRFKNLKKSGYFEVAYSENNQNDNINKNDKLKTENMDNQSQQTIKISSGNQIIIQTGKESVLNNGVPLNDSKNESVPKDVTLKKNEKESFIMQLFNRNKKIKPTRFYNVSSRKVDLAGLQAGVPEKMNIGVGSFKLETKYHNVSEKLLALDLMQYSLCNDINGINDQNIRDLTLKKIIETKTEMLNLILQLNSGNSDCEDNTLSNT